MSRRMLVSSGMGALGIKLGYLLLTLGISILFSRALGPEQFGSYAFVIALTSLLAIPCQIGLPNLIIRETARYQAVAKWQLLRGLWEWAIRTAFRSSLVFSALAVLFLTTVFDYEDRWMAVAAAAVIVPLIAAANVRAAMLTGLRHVVFGQLPEFLVRPVIVLAGGALFVLLAPSVFDAGHALLVYAGGALAGLVVAAGLRRRLAPDLVGRPQEPPAYETAAWWASALPLALIGGMRAINAQIDIILIGALRTEAEVGVYRVAVQAASLVAFGITVMNSVVAPHFSRYYTRGDRVALQRLVLLTSRLTAMASVPAAAIFIFWGEPILGLVFGAGYHAGAQPLALLALGYLATALWGPVATLLNMTGHERETLKGVTLGALANVGLNLALVPTYGMIGAAFSTLVTMLLWNLYLWRRVLQLTGIETFALFRSSRGNA